MYHLLYLLLIYFFLESYTEITNNNGNEKNILYKNRYTAHPKEDNIPFVDHDHEVIGHDQAIHQSSDPPDVISLFYNLLSSDYDPDKEKLDFYATYSDRFESASLSNKKLVMLDKAEDRFVSYDLENHAYQQLAENGQGPGDVMFTQSMEVQDDTIYVGMEDLRISRFILENNSIIYDHTLQTEIVPFSITLTSSELVTMGQPLVQDYDPDDKAAEYAAHILNRDGDISKSFGQSYQSDIYMLKNILDRGSIEYSPENNIYALAFNAFPYIYLFNEETELSKTFKLPNFELSSLHYYSDEMRLRREENQEESVIYHTTTIGSDWIIVHTFTNINPRSETNGEIIHDVRYDYYAINISKQKSYYIGNMKTESGQPQQRFHLSDYGILINKEGKLYWKGID